MAKQKTLTGLKNTKYSRKGLVLFVVVLDYLIGGKVAFGSICYYVRAVNPKGVGTVAQVDFAGQYNSKTISVPVSNNYQPVCISSGHSTTMKGYSVYNMSALDGPAILVYQAVINF
jgi:hypothetical protein